MPRGQFITPYGQLSPIGYYAMVAQLHMQRYGTTHRDLAEVAVAARNGRSSIPMPTGARTRRSTR